MNSPQQPPSHSVDVRNFYYTKRMITHPQAEIGEYTYGIPALRWFAPGVKLKIGKYCSISSEVNIILGGNHRPDWISQYPFPNLPTDWPKARGGKTPVSKGDVVIGNDVWIANGVTIMSGVTIGDGAVLGAKAVVAKNVPAYGIVVGNPAKLVKKRFSDEIIAFLLEVKWWDWPEAVVRDYVDLLCTPEIDKLKDLYTSKIKPLLKAA
ncbi:MAG: CatB-related O-acetyltransferase [Alphaproteobacteria bacterium]|nr:CatB-related O-acetyltransferase [Alphaproteobacteria bacterium]